MRNPSYWNLRQDSAFFTRAKRSANRVFVAYVEADAAPSDLVVIVPKTSSKLAVVRNRLKRRVKALFNQLDQRPARCVIVVKSSATTLEYDALRQNLEHLQSLW